ncbi:hypothetical protein V5799_019121 [Amblyomma americanum]|uniref:Uncharacterized protein n=1 Tax=Amblyomma americanum TaxID=6943 RepID=A0AAQ4EYD1_AMBAM
MVVWATRSCQGETSRWPDSPLSRRGPDGVGGRSSRRRLRQERRKRRAEQRRRRGTTVVPRITTTHLPGRRLRRLLPLARVVSVSPRPTARGRQTDRGKTIGQHTQFVAPYTWANAGTSNHQRRPAARPWSTSVAVRTIGSY